MKAHEIEKKNRTETIERQQKVILNIKISNQATEDHPNIPVSKRLLFMTLERRTPTTFLTLRRRGILIHVYESV